MYLISKKHFPEDPSEPLTGSGQTITVQNLKDVVAEFRDSAQSRIEVVEHEVRGLMRQNEPDLVGSVGTVHKGHTLTGVGKQAAAHWPAVGVGRSTDVAATQPLCHRADSWMRKPNDG